MPMGMVTRWRSKVKESPFEVFWGFGERCVILAGVGLQFIVSLL